MPHPARFFIAHDALVKSPRERSYIIPAKRILEESRVNAKETRAYIAGWPGG